MFYLFLFILLVCYLCFCDESDVKVFVCCFVVTFVAASYGS